MPSHLVIGFSLRIVFSLDDHVVFFAGDSALFFEADDRPLAFRHDWPGEPSHIEAEVVDPAQKDVRGYGTSFDAVEDLFGLGFNEHSWQECFESLVLGDACPTFAIIP